MIPIERLDHLVLTVRDIETSCKFYEKILGMSAVEFGDGRKALTFGSQKINLHQACREFQPHAKNLTRGSADLSFLTKSPVDNVMNFFKENMVEIIEGPVQRTGAMGPILSVYRRDPDGNLLEIANQLSTSTPDKYYAA